MKYGVRDRGVQDLDPTHYSQIRRFDIDEINTFNSVPYVTFQTSAQEMYPSSINLQITEELKILKFWGAVTSRPVIR